MKFVQLIIFKLLTIANVFLSHTAEHENFSANKYEHAKTIVGITIFINREIVGIFLFISRKYFSLLINMKTPKLLLAFSYLLAEKWLAWQFSYLLAETISFSAELSLKSFLPSELGFLSFNPSLQIPRVNTQLIF